MNTKIKEALSQTEKTAAGRLADIRSSRKLMSTEAQLKIKLERRRVRGKL